MLFGSAGGFAAEGETEDAESLRPFGYTAGEFAVNESGAATYSIPITVPPGTAGMEPKLALAYTSQAGNALLGAGWSLAGLSAISRCPATMAQDGEPGGVALDDGDRFCLDGERLMAISGEDGEDGSEYRTEQNSFRRVISHGQAGDGPESWTVETRSGLRFEYGTSEDSRIEVPGRNAALIWNVHRAVDTLGNYFEVTYEEDTAAGSYRPLEIRYTGNEAAELEPYASVSFHWEERPDVRRRHVAGGAMTVSHRLSEILVEDGEDLYRQYLLAYESGATGVSRLVSITECGSLGVCFEPTVFEWNESAQHFEDEVQVGADPYSPAGSGWYRWLLDMTGDGLADYVYMRSGTRSIYVLANSPEGLAADEYWGWLNHNFNGNSQFFIDFDSDGLTDYVYRRNNTNDFWLLRNEGDGFAGDVFLGSRVYNAASNDDQWWRDVDGDGFVDYIYRRAGTSDYYWKPGDGEGLGPEDFWGVRPRGFDEVWVLDMDRDQLPDLYYRDGGRFYVMRGSGDGLEAEELWGQRDYGDHNSWNIDLNADGLTDYVYRRSGTWHYYFLPNTGEGFGEERYVGTASGGVEGGGSEQWLEDVTGDGYPDLVYERNSTNDLYVMAFDGEDFASAVQWGEWSTPRHQNHNWVEDMTGDGLADYFFLDYWGSNFYSVNNAGPPPDMLVGITEGNGRRTTIELAPLTDPDVYTKGAEAEFPRLDYQGTAHVVAAYSVDDGLGDVRRFSRRYGGAQINVQGRGFRGFLETTVVDELSGLQTTVFYERDYRCISSKILRTEQRLADGTLVQETDNEIEVQDHGFGVSFSFVRSSTTKRYDSGGTLLQTTTTSSDYDTKGNLVETVVERGDGHVETTTHTYGDDMDRWLLGRLTRSEVLATAPGQDELTRVSAFAYDETTGLLVEEITEPDRPELRLVKTYTHDVFGNIETSTTSAEGQVPRLHTTFFDERGRHVVQTINAAGHVESSAYLLGRRISRTGPNGLVTTWQHDGFGRVTHELRPDLTFTDTVIAWCEEDDPCPEGAVYYTRTATPGAPESVAYFDLHDRELRRQVTGFDGTPVLRDSVYDERGRLVAVSEPFFEGREPLWTSYVYDALDRVIEERAPGDRVTTTEYEGLGTHITNTLDQVSSRLVDVQGRLVQSVDALGESTFYRYDAFGNVLEIEDSAGHLTTMTYDVRGQRLEIDDPDTGLTSSTYDAFGQLIEQTDALGRTSTLGYDALGRLVSRSEPEGTSTWTYDQCNMGVGKVCSSTGPDGFRRDFSFDGYGRPFSAQAHIDGETYSSYTGYDAFGRVDTLTYPSGLSVRTDYNLYGHPFRLRRSDGLVTYWQAEAVNARGQLESASLGNGLSTERYHDSETGLLEEVTAGSSVDAVQSLVFAYDPLGNLVERGDVLRGLTETFDYDDLQRLVETQVLGQDAVFISYDDLGNIRSRSDVGIYNYGEYGAGPHAVTSIIGEANDSYFYDGVGNRVASSSGSVLYTSFNKPRRIEQGQTVLTFDYGADRRRYRQVETTGGETRTKLYVSELFERHESAAGTKDLHYLRAGGEVVAVHVEETGEDDRLLYLHRDHLGSVQTITDGEGVLVEALSYDAWGRRRDAELWAQPPAGTIFADGFESGDTSRWGSGGGSPAGPASCLDRGFTGHEHLDSVDLIHMNGRVYDPVIGRFLTADPHVQAPDFSQSLNRYSYVLNNPLSLTDPSGFFFKSIFKAIGKFFKSVAKFVVKNLPAIISLGVGLLTGGVLLPALLPALGLTAGGIFGAVLSGAAMGFASSFTGALLMGADLGTALSMGLMSAAIAGVTAGLTSAGDLFSQVLSNASETFKILQEALVSGLIDGVKSELDGGKFQHGFFSTAFSKFFTPFVDKLDTLLERTIAAAVVGGTAAELGGRKFGNGALSAAGNRILDYLEERFLNDIFDDVKDYLGIGDDQQSAGRPLQLAQSSDTESVRSGYDTSSDPWRIQPERTTGSENGNSLAESLIGPGGYFRIDESTEVRPCTSWLSSSCPGDFGIQFRFAF